MTDNSGQWERIAVIGDLVEKASSSSFGRTALMKCLYFLKTLRGVPLEYHFTLYTYGPFDSDVLEDASYAAALGILRSKMVSFSGGYGYQFEPGPRLQEARERATDFLSKYEKEIEWVANEFGQRSASELEMLSTIVYVDRSSAARGAKLTLEDLTRKVREVKPRLSPDQIRGGAAKLKDGGWLRYVD